MHAARRELVGIRTHLGRTEPHLPVDVGIRRAFLRRILGIVPETHRVGRTAKLLSAAAVVRVDVHHVADHAATDDRDRRTELLPAALHGAGLEHAAVLLLRGNDLLRLVDRKGQRLLAIDVLAVLHRLDGDVGMPVIGRTDADEVDRRILNDLTEIVDGAAFVRLVGLVDLLSTCERARLVAIANDHDLNLVARVALVQELRNQSRTHLNAATDHRATELLTGLERTKADLARRTTGKRHRRGRAKQETSTIDVHCLFFPFFFTT